MGKSDPREEKEEFNVTELHLRLPKGVVDAIDAQVAKGKATTRSGLVTTALLIWLSANDPKFMEKMQEIGKTVAEQLGPIYADMAKALDKKLPPEEAKKLERVLVKKILEELG